MHQFHKFILSWNFTCVRQFLCPSSGVYSLYTQQWYTSYRFVDSFRVGPRWSLVQSWSCTKLILSWNSTCSILVLLESCLQTCVTYIPLLSVQWINSWWWTDELSETCRVSWQNKFVKLVHLVGFITKVRYRVHRNSVRPLRNASWRR
jgi:hypothetical protein